MKMKGNQISAVMMKVIVMPGWQSKTVTETPWALWNSWSQGTVQLPTTNTEHRL